MVVQEEQYDPWGLSLTGLSSQSMVNSNRFKFIGREEQQGLGWIDLQARPYDPQIGRFTGVDPLPDTEGQESISTYHYSYNNPIRFSDPDGKMSEDCCDGIGSFLMGVGGAIRDNLSPDGGGSRRDTPANAGLYNSGREAGHQVSLVLSAGIIAAGVAGDVAAAAGEIASFGMATVPAAALAVASTGAVVYGAGVANNAINNRIDDKGRVYASSHRNSNQTSGNNSAAQRGKKAHKEFAEKVEKKAGWQSEPTLIGKDVKKYKPDALTPSGHMIELKPNTPRGHSRGKAQMENYKKQTGRQGRVIYYD